MYFLCKYLPLDGTITQRGGTQTGPDQFRDNAGIWQWPTTVSAWCVCVGGGDRFPSPQPPGNSMAGALLCSVTGTESGCRSGCVSLL